VTTGTTAEVGRSPWDSQHVEFDYRIDDVDGRIPDNLNGVLYRIGPGRLDVGGHPVNHIFDGDGMVSRIEIRSGDVHYRSRYVRTRAYARANDASRPPRGIGTQRVGGVLANALRGPANMSNTNVLLHNNKLYSLWEGGRPHRLDPETLATIGRDGFDGGLKRLGAFSAHPKTDPETGETFNFGLDFFPRPMIRCYRLAPGGSFAEIHRIPISRLGFVHDFALTRRYLVFIIDPIVVKNPVPAVLGLRPIDDALTFEPNRGTRIVLVPRAGGAPISIDHDALFHFHVNNAYDGDAETVVELVAHDANRGWEGWNAHLHNFRDNPGPAFGGTLKRLIINRHTRKVTEEQLNDAGCEFPQLDQRKATVPHRFSYLAEASSAGGNPDTITTIDHRCGTQRGYVAAAGDTICEPLFAPDDTSGAEGDGWLLTLEHQPATQRSRVVVLPARNPDRGPVASINLRHHVPMTFHGAFLPDAAGRPG